MKLATMLLLWRPQKTGIMWILNSFCDVLIQLLSLKRLDSEDHRRLEALKRWNPNHHQAVLWLRQNKHRFDMEVFEPPCLSVSMKDPKYADAVESCFSANQLQVSLSFLAPRLVLNLYRHSLPNARKTTQP